MEERASIESKLKEVERSAEALRNAFNGYEITCAEHKNGVANEFTLKTSYNTVFNLYSTLSSQVEMLQIQLSMIENTGDYSKVRNFIAKQRALLINMEKFNLEKEKQQSVKETAVTKPKRKQRYDVEVDCKHCSFKNMSLATWIDHATTHFNDRKFPKSDHYQCINCNFTSIEYVEQMEHAKNIHKKVFKQTMVRTIPFDVSYGLRDYIKNQCRLSTGIEGAGATLMNGFDHYESRGAKTPTMSPGPYSEEDMQQERDRLRASERGATTPHRDGGRTPAFEDGGRTPTYGNGGRTPAFEDGGRTPAYGVGGTTPAYGVGGTTPAYGNGGTTPTYGNGGTTPAYGVGGTTPAYGVGGTTPAYGNGGTTPAYGDDGTIPAYGDGGTTPAYGDVSRTTAYDDPTPAHCSETALNVNRNFNSKRPATPGKSAATKSPRGAESDISRGRTPYRDVPRFNIHSSRTKSPGTAKFIHRSQVTEGTGVGYKGSEARRTGGPKSPRYDDEVEQEYEESLKGNRKEFEVAGRSNVKVPPSHNRNSALLCGTKSRPANSGKTSTSSKIPASSLNEVLETMSHQSYNVPAEDENRYMDQLEQTTSRIVEQTPNESTRPAAKRKMTLPPPPPLPILQPNRVPAAVPNSTQFSAINQRPPNGVPKFSDSQYLAPVSYFQNAPTTSSSGFIQQDLSKPPPSYPQPYFYLQQQQQQQQQHVPTLQKNLEDSNWSQMMNLGQRFFVAHQPQFPTSQPPPPPSPPPPPPSPPPPPPPPIALSEEAQNNFEQHSLMDAYGERMEYKPSTAALARSTALLPSEKNTAPVVESSHYIKPSEVDIVKRKKIGYDKKKAMQNADSRSNDWECRDVKPTTAALARSTALLPSEKNTAPVVESSHYIKPSEVDAVKQKKIGYDKKKAMQNADSRSNDVPSSSSG